MASFALARIVASPVEFHYTSSTAKSVQIAGDFNAWGEPTPMTRDGSSWTAKFDFPDDARIEYKFVVDGRWIIDPSNPMHNPNGVGGDNSAWQGMEYRLSVDDRPPKTPLRRSQITVGGRAITVFAPLRSKGLPVLVYGDGPNYEDPGRIQNIVENLVEKQRIRPAVIILVPPVDRMKEYGAGWKEYGQYIFNEILPAVQKSTGASDSARDVYMGGSSMGGLIALRLAEEFPDKLAGGIQCQSTAIQWDPGSIDFADASTPAKLRQIARNCRIWLDWGTFEDSLTTANVQLAGTLKSIHRSFGSRITHEGHNWTAWRNRMESGLTYILGIHAGKRWMRRARCVAASARTCRSGGCDRSVGSE